MKHSDLIGGSSAKRRIQCTGSAALEAQFPNVVSEAALEGTALHALMYNVMTDDVPLPEKGEPCSVFFDEVDSNGEPYTAHYDIDAETMTSKFWPVYEALEDLIERFGLTMWNMEMDRVLHKTCGPEVFGTMDFAGRNSRGQAVFVDFKFGLGTQIDPRENDQLAFYATGLVDNEDPIVVDAEELVFIILQPPLFEDGEVCKEWRTTPLWLDLWRSNLQTAYRRIKANDVSYKAGDWCQFCRGAPACPARNDALVKFAKDVQAQELPAGLTVAQLSHLLDVGSVAVQQFEVVRKYAEKLAAAGTPIPGWKLKESLGHRAFLDEHRAESLAVKLLGTEAYAPKTLKSPAQLEKTAKTMKVDFSPLAELIHRPSRGGRLVPDSDPSPEMHVAIGPIELPAELIHLADRRKKNEER